MTSAESVTITRDGPVQVVVLPKSLPLAVAERLRGELPEIVDRQCPNVLFDLSRIGMIGSAVLATMLGVRRRAAQCGGRVAIAAPQPAVKRVLHLMRLDGVFPVYAGLDEGRAFLRDS